MAKLIAFVSSGLLFVLFVGFVAYVRFISPPGTFFRSGVDTPAVVREVQQLNELVTVRYLVEKVVAMKEEKVPVGSESILLLVQAKVLAGVSLKEMTQYNVTMRGAHAVTIALPEAHIVDAYINEKQTRVWNRSVTWWTPWIAPDLNLEHRARLAAIEQVRKAAIDEGILNEAVRNAQSSISNLLHALGVSDVKFAKSAT
jgi:hypothetical protein